MKKNKTRIKRHVRNRRRKIRAVREMNQFMTELAAECRNMNRAELALIPYVRRTSREEAPVHPDAVKLCEPVWHPARAVQSIARQHRINIDDLNAARIRTITARADTTDEK